MRQTSCSFASTSSGLSLSFTVRPGGLRRSGLGFAQPRRHRCRFSFRWRRLKKLIATPAVARQRSQQRSQRAAARCGQTAPEASSGGLLKPARRPAPKIPQVPALLPSPAKANLLTKSKLSLRACLLVSRPGFERCLSFHAEDQFGALISSSKFELQIQILIQIRIPIRIPIRIQIRIPNSQIRRNSKKIQTKLEKL